MKCQQRQLIYLKTTLVLNLPATTWQDASAPSSTIARHRSLCASASVAVWEADVPMRRGSRQIEQPPPSTLHSPYDYLSIYPTATIARPPPTPSKHHHLSLQQSFVWASSTLVSRQLGWITRGWRPTACSQDVQTARDCKRPLNSQRNGCLLW